MSKQGNKRKPVAGSLPLSQPAAYWTARGTELLHTRCLGDGPAPADTAHRQTSLWAKRATNTPCKWYHLAQPKNEIQKSSNESDNINTNWLRIQWSLLQFFYIVRNFMNCNQQLKPAFVHRGRSTAHSVPAIKSGCKLLFPDLHRRFSGTPL